MKQTDNNLLCLIYVFPSKNNLKGKRQKNDISNPHFPVVGIKFDYISTGNFYPGNPGSKNTIRFEAEGSNKPSVLCQSTFL